LLHALPFPALRKIERQTKKMGELLGEDRDLGLLCANLQNRVIANVPPEVILQVCGRITRRQKTLQRKVSELGDKIVDTMLDIFPKAIGKCLKSWRGKNAAAAAP
ncbi:MAG: hypothetical protein V4710_04585, partial [Verrucomicrobiota bacterium]